MAVSTWGSHLNADKWREIGAETINTLLMLAAALPTTLLAGLVLGVTLYLTGPGRLLRLHPAAYQMLSLLVNVVRSLPFIILMIVLVPVTLWIMGVTYGVRGTILPLTIGTAPFYARLVETSLREVDRGVIEASQSMGANTWQLVWRVLLPEALPGLISGATITAIVLVGFTAMAGAIGAGGLGDLAHKDGYQRFQTDVAAAAVVILLVIVQLLQMLGDALARRFDHR
ncbi:MAG: ABC transporter permease [Xanthomonadaceae bacterium]|nr:ABC transporter permease [Xanthomonadaceae bacterium]